MSKFYTHCSVHKNRILHIGYEDGVRFQKLEKFVPHLAIETNQKSKYKGIYNENLEKIEFKDIAQYLEYVKQNKDILELYNNIEPNYQFLRKHYPKNIVPNMKDIRIFYLDIEVDDRHGFPKPELAQKKIMSIAIYDSKKDCYYALGYQKFTIKKLPNRNKKIYYKQCEDEYELLESFVKLFEKLKPDVCVGHYSKSFDYPYLINRMEQVAGLKMARRMSPVGKVWTNSREYNGKLDFFNTVIGVAMLDFLDLYKKYRLVPRESYSLQFLASEELSQGKVQYEEYDTIHELYEKNFEKGMLYNIIDVDLLVQMEAKLQLVATHIMVAHMAKINIEDAKSPVKVWDTLIYNFLYEKNILIPPIPSIHQFSFPGAFVMEPNPKISKWIVSFDLNSLYPHLQMQYNISPEMLMEETLSDIIDELNDEKIDSIIQRLKKNKEPQCQIDFMESLKINSNVYIDGEKIDNKLLEQKIPIKYILPKDVCCAANGHLFDVSEQGFFPHILEEKYNTRKIEKEEKNKTKALIQSILKEKGNEFKKSKKYHDLSFYADFKHVLQNTLKVLLNSGYGALSNAYFRYNAWELASAVTLGGQLSIKYIINETIKEFSLIEALASDTDSCYLSLEKIIPNEFIQPINALESQIVELEEELMSLEEDYKDTTKIKNEIKQLKEKLFEWQIKTTDWIDNYCEETIIPFMDKAYKKLADYMNCKENKMTMKREKIAFTGLWTAKKKYATLTIDSEHTRYANPALEVTGLEIKRSSTPKLIRDKLRTAIELLLSNQNMFRLFVKKYKKEFFNMKPEDIAFPRSVNNISKYSDRNGNPAKGCPINVRGTLTFNQLLKTENLENTYPKIEEGNKIKFIYLKEPNPLHSHVIAFPRVFPMKEKFAPYIDYHKQYDKTFYHVISLICERIGVDVKKSKKLSDIF